MTTDALFSGFRTNSTIYIFCNLREWLKHGRAAHLSASNVICVYQAIPLTYIYNVIDRTYNNELLAEYDWDWLKRTVQDSNLQVTSDGRWLADPDEAGKITLTHTWRCEVNPA